MTDRADDALERRRALLTAALGFMQLREPPASPAFLALTRWLDSWSGIGAVTVGMARQGFDLQLTEYGGENWRATFYTVGMAHSVVRGSAYEATPGRAVQRAAWAALNNRPLVGGE